MERREAIQFSCINYILYVIFREDRDWGIYQLAAVSDRTSINESPFWVLTTFGDHGLHHLFPTLDHAILEQLHPIFNQTCEEFSTALKMNTWLNLAVGQFKNISRVEPSIRKQN